MDIPTDILILHKLFTQNNYTLYIVGGAVRDFLCGKMPHDYDLVTNASPHEMMHILQGYRYNLDGVKFSVIRVFTASCPLGYEIATYRKDISKGRDTTVATGKNITIEDDASRRDITINALYYDIHTHTIIDIVGGISDLQNNIIRAVGNPQHRFNEDRLRILRILRFVAIMDGHLDETTADAIKHDNRIFGISPEDDVSKERIFTEFIKAQNAVSKFIDLLIDYDIMSQIFPVMITYIRTPTICLTCALAQVLIHNIPNVQFRNMLIHNRIPNKYTNGIIFVISIYQNGVQTETVYKIHYDMKKNISIDILAEWIRVMDITDPMIIGLLTYHPTVHSADVIKDGFTGKNITVEIARRESELYMKHILQL